MTDQSSDGSARNGEVLEDDQPHSVDGTNWLALISNYTERPDLFLAEVEKHDPGFVKRMNQDARDHDEKNKTGRFNFGRRQAYAGLIVSVVAALVLLGFIGISVWKNQGFWTIIALGIVYAITQGGSAGFLRLIEGISSILGKAPKQ